MSQYIHALSSLCWLLQFRYSGYRHVVMRVMVAWSGLGSERRVSCRVARVVLQSFKSSHSSHSESLSDLVGTGRHCGRKTRFRKAAIMSRPLFAERFATSEDRRLLLNQISWRRKPGFWKQINKLNTSAHIKDCGTVTSTGIYFFLSRSTFRWLGSGEIRVLRGAYACLWLGCQWPGFRMAVAENPWRRKTGFSKNIGICCPSQLRWPTRIIFHLVLRIKWYHQINIRLLRHRKQTKRDQQNVLNFPGDFWVASHFPEHNGPTRNVNWLARTRVWNLPTSRSRFWTKFF